MELNIDRSNWTKVKLGDVAFEYSKRINNPSESEFDRFVGSSNIGQWDFRVKSWESTNSVTSAMKLFEPNDYLLVRRSLYASDFRERAPRAHFSGVCSGDILTIKENNEKIVDGFLIGIFNSPALWKYVVANASGSITRRIKWKDLSNYEFLLPPKDQQAQLAELLWAMDEVIERNNEILRVNEKLFLAFSKSIFSDDMGKEVELKNVGELIMGQSPPGKSYNENGNGIPFLQGNAEFGEINPSHIKYTTAANKIVEKGTILISVRAPVGDLNLADRKYCIGRGLAGLYIDNEILRDYVYNFLKYARLELERNSTGSTFKAVNKDILSSLKLFIPEEDILKSNSTKLNYLLKVKALCLNKISISKSLQKSLINQIF